MSKPKARISFTVDGKKCSAAPGQTILQAAKDNGIYIPALCRWEGFKPAGACRVCTVRVGGRYMAACTQPVTDGMAVENDVPDLQDMRKALIEMLFVEGNHMCPTCEKSGNCELQALAYRFLMLVPRFPFQFPARRVEPAGKKILLEHNRCIKCLRCVRGVRTRDNKAVFGTLRRSRDKKNLRGPSPGLRLDGQTGPAGHGPVPGRLHPEEGSRLRRPHRPAEVRQGTNRQRRRKSPRLRRIP